jgi:hypothetical protein
LSQMQSRRLLPFACEFRRKGVLQGRRSEQDEGSLLSTSQVENCGEL